MLSSIDMNLGVNKIDWVITGGESDRNNPRPINHTWVQKALLQCREEDVPFFHKQMGTWYAQRSGYKHWKGEDPSEWPENIRVREFPHIVYQGV
jgi:protein gp37